MKKLLRSILRIQKEQIQVNGENDDKENVSIPVRFSKWIKEIESTKAPNDKIIAYNFGLFESNGSYMMYLIGCKKYDTKNEDWVCDVDYEPKNKYFDLHNAELNNSKWEFVLEYAVKLVKGFMKTENYYQSFLVKSEYITIGFDDGNLIQLK
ncbi:hypothetical protein [Aquimarina sp. 2201CG14-23]|uniref:hypothetical protein n=1 Tax=Aquimarina mycalae TaxID=3040073 RepID=UPI0024780B7B|nr:hypothetical protein [Aquimarina sp. 2201CG14-23]MDH7445652.1 hypothetical protein [Aquimarina sp. 2201CG14-23]